MNSLGFSTLGCPGSPADIIDLAHGFGCGGLELRCYHGEIITPDSPDHRAVEIGQTFARAGITVFCLASYVQVGAAGDGVEANLHRHLELARLVGARYLRVFGADPAAAATSIAAATAERAGTATAATSVADRTVADRAVGRLRDATEAADRAGVTILLETHDSFLTGRAVANLLEQAGSDSAGALWDVVNPWRAGESLATTAAALRPWLAHVQVKDVAAPGDLAPVVPGTGAVPLTEFAAQLDRIGYTGWVSLEWESAWFPGAAPLTDALSAFTEAWRR